ncbi:MAG: putative lipid II flippase FtsW [Patescibacteria group bacterium]|nr:putative lipid II flippase FtsW [Patescibacteria group bacterium]MCL5224200.1 putative lipid II flippase FtsW [Patescibacteria group bacterium]
MRQRGHADYIILVTFIILVAFGFMMLASASSDLGKTNFNNPYYYIEHQIMYGFSLGVVGFLIGLLVPYKFYKRYALLFLIATIALLVIVFVPHIGVSSGGAQRWINVGPLTVQPGEVTKLLFIMYLAAWLSSARKDRRTRTVTEGLIPFWVTTGLVAVLLLLEHSTSSVFIVLAGALTVYFAAGAKKFFLLATFVLGGLLVGAFILITPYRLARIDAYLNPSAQNVYGSGYQINQSLLTIGSGSLFGVGYGNSVSKRYLPARLDDAIFAIIAEEFGFIGSVAVVALFFTLVGRGLILAKKMSDPMGKSILVGFSTIIGVQVFLHIGSVSQLIPLTGVPLPFISYGGTALAVFMTMVGIMLNISKYV